MKEGTLRNPEIATSASLPVFSAELLSKFIITHYVRLPVQASPDSTPRRPQVRSPFPPPAPLTVLYDLPTKHFYLHWFVSFYYNICDLNVVISVFAELEAEGQILRDPKSPDR